MKKYFKVLCLVCLVMFVCMLAFAGGEGKKEEAPAPEEKVEAPVAPKEGPFKFVASCSEAPVMAVGDWRAVHPIWAAFLAFQNAVNSRIGDGIEIELYHSGQLGSNEETLEHLTANIQQGILVGEGDLARYFTPFNLIGAPYVFKAPIVFYEVFDGPFGDKFKEAFRQETGLRIIGFWENAGFRNLVNSKRPVHHPDDVKGLKIRTMMIPAHMAIIESWGGQATPISWSELYTSAQTGVVDGFENSYINFIPKRLYEVFDYLTLTQHVFASLGLVINDAWFQSLPEEYQMAVLEGGKYAELAGRGGCRHVEELCATEIKSMGKQIYVPTPEEKEAFRSLAIETGMDFLRETVEKEWVDEFLAAIDEAEKKWGYQ